MMKNLGIVGSVFMKDLRVMMNYKMNLILTFLSIFLYLFFIYSLSEAFVINDGISKDGNINTFIFLLTGLIILDLTITCSVSAPLNVSFYQTSGILEELIHNEKRFALLTVSSMCFPFVFSIFKFAIYLVTSLVFFGAEILINANILILLVFFFIYVSFLAGLGLLASSITIVFKRGNPLIRLNTIITAMLGGALFPTQTLGNEFDLISDFIPGKHIIEITRNILLQENITISSLLFNGISLICFSITFLAAGYVSFIYALRYTKMNNTTSDY